MERKKEVMGKRNGLREGSPPCGSRGELCRVRGSLLRLSPRMVWHFASLQKRSEQWVVEFVAPASNANQESLFRHSAEVLALEFVIEFMDRHFLLF